MVVPDDVQVLRFPLCFFPLVFFYTFLFNTMSRTNNTGPLRCFIGTYTDQTSRGIYTCRFHTEDGRLETPTLAAECNNPTFLALHPSMPHLYAIGKFPAGMLRAFRYDKQSGSLALLNEQEIPGHGPCHLAFCPSEDGLTGAVVVANYGSGCAASFPIFDDGKIGAVASHITHSGSGPNPVRQQNPHVHGIYPDGSTVMVVDLGIDRIVHYCLDFTSARLSPSTDHTDLRLTPGAGPRHLVVSKDQRFVYVVNELDSTVSVFERHVPDALQSISTLPPGKEPAVMNNTASEIALHPNGKFLYVSNRGDDSLAVFALNAGKPALIQTISSGGKTPRFFCLDPTGRFLLACNQDSENVCVFNVEQETGMVTSAGHSINVSKPACLVFAPEG